jgi:excisionase family DNA binding protein
MTPLPAQLSLFELDACDEASSRPIDLPVQRGRVDESKTDHIAPTDARAVRDRRRAPLPSSSLLSPEDVALRFGLSRKAVYRAVARGELRAARIRSRLRIDPGDLEAWFQANLVDPMDPPTPTVPARLPVSTGLRRLLPGT